MMTIGKSVNENMTDGISIQIVDVVYYQKERLVSWACEEDCDAILYDVVVNIMEQFEIDNLIILNPFL